MKAAVASSQLMEDAPETDFGSGWVGAELLCEARAFGSPLPNPPREGEGAARWLWRSHNGMLSCFLAGIDCCLLRRVSNERATRRLVSWGMMTSSMKPRSAATKGL